MGMGENPDAVDLFGLVVYDLPLVGVMIPTLVVVPHPHREPPPGRLSGFSVTLQDGLDELHLGVVQGGIEAGRRGGVVRGLASRRPGVCGTGAEEDQAQGQKGRSGRATGNTHAHTIPPRARRVNRGGGEKHRIDSPRGRIYSRGRGVGMMTEEPREVGVFYEVINRSPARVQIRRGGRHAVLVRGPNHVVGSIKTRVRGARLIVSVRNPFEMENEDLGDVMVLVETEVLERVISGAGAKGDTEVLGGFETPELVLVSRGNGGIYAEVSTKSLVAKTNGMGSITAMGDAESFKAIVQGMGSVYARDLVAKRADVRMMSMGTVEVFALDYLETRFNSVGTVEYLGDPVIKRTGPPGQGKIRRLGV